MKIGNLRHRITIQKKSATRDSYGAETISWTTYLTVWAAIEPLRGREYMEARQVQADVDTRIRMRAQSVYTIKPGMQVLFGARIFDIISVIEVEERNREVQLMCREQIEG